MVQTAKSAVTLSPAADARTLWNLLAAVRANILRPQLKQVFPFRLGHLIKVVGWTTLV